MALKRKILKRREDQTAPVPSPPALDRPKRGRRTIPDNYLLGSRNNWLKLLEECWCLIGWHLLSIRDRRKSTTEDIRTAFEPVKKHPHNPGLAQALYRESAEPASIAEFRKRRRRLSALEAEIRKLEKTRDEWQRAYEQAEAALKYVAAEDLATIEAERSKRLINLDQTQATLKGLNAERDGLASKTLDQESFIYRSELLDYLHSRRYALNPKNLAHSLAGLPRMKWRQSFARCARLPKETIISFEYQIFNVLLQLCSQKPDFLIHQPADFLRQELLKLPKKLGYTRQFLWENWRDLKRAIKECHKSEPVPAAVPYLLTSLFLRYARESKNPAEQILAELDRLQLATTKATS